VGRVAQSARRQNHHRTKAMDKENAMAAQRHGSKIMDTNMTPKISVIMPTYNRARYIAEAIRSVQNQTLREWEMIVIDDGSNDDTEKIVREIAAADPRISYFKNEKNLGIAKTRNRGVGLAKADYVAMLDSDDYWVKEDKLARQLEAFEKNMKLGIVGVNACFIDENGKVVGKRTNFPSNDTDIRQTELYRNILMQSGLLIKKSAILKAGGYDSSFSVFDDHDLWLKIGIDHGFMILPSVDLSYRVHKGGITIAKRIKAAKEGTRILFKYKNRYPGFLMGLFTCIGRFFTSRLIIFWFRTWFSSK
jgi:glycosyltransferase involved in cell wall biosynthesis